MDLILKHSKIDITVVDSNGWTALHHACDKGNQSAITELVSFDGFVADVVNNKGQTPFHIAVSKGNHTFVQYFLKITEGTVNVQRKDVDDNTCLHIICSSQEVNDAMLHTLLTIEDVADLINEKNVDGNVPLMLLLNNQKSQFLSDDILNMFLERQKLNVRNRYGESLFSIAVAQKHNHTASAMLENSNFKLSAYDYAEVLSQNNEILFATQTEFRNWSVKTLSDDYLIETKAIKKPLNNEPFDKLLSYCNIEKRNSWSAEEMVNLRWYRIIRFIIDKADCCVCQPVKTSDNFQCV